MRTEYISCEHGGHAPGGMRDCDVWVRPDLEGFYNCDRSGTGTDENTEYRRCDRCGRVVELTNGEAISKSTAPPAR